MKFTAAVVQAGSIVMDRDACVDKAVDLIREAGRQGAQLILLPEGFVPAYPWGLSFGAPVGSRSAEGRQLFERYFANAVEVPSPELDMAEIARGRFDFDVTGHYAKPDVFRLIVDESEKKAIVGGNLSDLDL